MPTWSDWREDLVKVLVMAGPVGKKKSDIVNHFRNRIGADALQAELEALWAQDKVQRFSLPPLHGHGGRTTTVWRATTKIHS